MAVASGSQAQSPRELLVLCPAAPGAALGDGLCGEAATLLACGLLGTASPVWEDCPSPGPPETRMQRGLGASHGSGCFSLSLQSLEPGHSITF